MSALPTEVQSILKAHPELGINGFLCRFTNSAASFPTDREAAFRPDFLLDVATVLERLADRRRGVLGYVKEADRMARTNHRAIFARRCGQMTFSSDYHQNEYREQRKRTANEAYCRLLWPADSIERLTATSKQGGE